jgi:hypothetical protein
MGALQTNINDLARCYNLTLMGAWLQGRPCRVTPQAVTMSQFCDLPADHDLKRILKKPL